MALVLITGVSRGLGRGLAEEALRRGNAVIGAGRSCPKGIEKLGDFTFIELDLSVTEMIEGVLSRGVPESRRIDCAILNAGTHGPLRASADVGIDELESVMRLNTFANKVVLDWLLSRERPPKEVLGISSGAAFNGSGGWLAYCVSKSALNLLLRVYSFEYPETHFAAVAPGLVRTAMTEKIRDAEADDRFPANARIQQAFEEGRVIEPNEAAKRFWDLMDWVRSQASGSYVDLRKAPPAG